MKKDWPKKTDIPRQIGFDAMGDCTLRLRRGSRYIRLSFNRKNGLTLTSPVMLSDQQIKDCLQKHYQWLEKVQASVIANFDRYDFIHQLNAQKTIDFIAIPDQFFIEIKPPNQSSRLYLRENGQQLIFSGATNDTEKIRVALRRWLNRKADTLLSPVFHHYARTHGFSPQSLSWKTLSSRWGSCTSQGKINLNAKLLFFPMSLVIYIFAHELTHLKEMNHSRRFYEKLNRLLPDYLLREANLKIQQRHLPAWLSLL